MTIPYGNEYDEDGHPVGSLLTKMFSGAWLDSQTFPALEEIVPGVLVEGLTVLVGPPKVGKSWLVGNLALSCAEGGTALSAINVEARPVLYLALEDGPRRLQHRLRVLSDGQPLPNGLDMLCNVEPGAVEATIAEYLLAHKDSAPPLVFLDTLGKARPAPRAGDDRYLADYRLGSQLKRLVDDVPGSGLVLVHHSNKRGDDGDFVDSVSGTQGIAGSCDSVLVLRRPRKSTDATLAITGRDVTEREIALTVDDGRWRLDGFTVESAAEVVEIRKEQGAQGDRSLDVLAFARSCDEVTPKAVADHMKIDAKSAGTYLGRLVDRGHLFKRGYGKYSHHPGTSTASTTPEGLT